LVPELLLELWKDLKLMGAFFGVCLFEFIIYS
jgi:hypothetical protein